MISLQFKRKLYNIRKSDACNLSYKIEVKCMFKKQKAEDSNPSSCKKIAVSGLNYKTINRISI